VKKRESTPGLSPVMFHTGASMQLGNWIPLDKSFVRDLPKDRTFTELEAAYSLQLDYDNNKQVTLQGYASLWRWSIGKVKRFLERLGASIEYAENTHKLKNQNGNIMIHKPEIKREYNGNKRLIDSKWLANKPKINRKYNGNKTEIKRYATIDPETKPNPEPIIFTSQEGNILGEFKNVHLSEDELQKLNSSLGKEKAEDLIERLSSYMVSSGKGYNSHYATLLNWSRKDQKESKKGGRKDEPDFRNPDYYA
jgi:hypothetical protein